MPDFNSTVLPSTEDRKLSIRTGIIEGIRRTAGIHQYPIIGKNASEYNIALPEDTDEDLAGASNDPSYLGLPVYSNLEIEPGTYEDENGDLVDYAQDDFTVNTVLFTVNRTTNIVVTPIAGLNGTVKELISKGDYAITIEGLLVGENGNMPQEQIRELSKIEGATEAIAINSNYLNLYDIDNIVIQSMKVQQLQGNRNVVSFTINALSDKPIELELADQ